MNIYYIYIRPFNLERINTINYDITLTKKLGNKYRNNNGSNGYFQYGK